LGDGGQPLQGGVYTLVLVWVDAGGRHTISQPMTVIPKASAEPLALAHLQVNPLPPGQPLRVQYAPCACQVQARLYDLNGQLVSQGADAGSGLLTVPVDRRASGIYLLELKAFGGGLRPQRVVLKAALLR
jgi:hypothetical protein